MVLMNSGISRGDFHWIALFIHPLPNGRQGMIFHAPIPRGFCTRSHYDDTLPTPRVSFNDQDFWAGHAFQIFKGKSEDQRTTNFVSTAISFLRVRCLEKPAEIFANVQPLSRMKILLCIHWRFILGNLSMIIFVSDLASQRMYQSESLQYHRRLSAESKWNRQYISVPALQMEIIFRWGYLVQTSAKFGTFIKGSQHEQGILTAEINYFNRLKEIGKWKFRQFIKPEVTIGLNRLVTIVLPSMMGMG